MSLPVTLDELFAFEKNIESGMVAMLLYYGLPSPQSSRSQTDFNTPYVSLWFQNGEGVNENQHAITGWPGRFFPFNTFTGTLTTECVTNRQTAPADSHTTLIAKMRGALQMWRIATLWKGYQPIDLIAQIKEGGTIDTWEDEHGLDHTTITWDIIHSLNPDAWPEIPPP